MRRPAPPPASWLDALAAGDRVIRDRSDVLVAPSTHIIGRPAADGGPPQTRCGWSVDDAWSFDLIGKGTPCVACHKRRRGGAR